MVYNLLFQATAETLKTIAADPKHLGADLGFFAVLHTWGQDLLHHPHLHCVVPGGGLSPDKHRWIPCRPDFFLPVKVLARFFRRCFIEALEHAFTAGELRFFSTLAKLQSRERFQQYLVPVRKKNGVVYAKPPFAGPEQVLDYVGRYTHRVAIANHRLLEMEAGHVRFRWKDYAADDQQQIMTLTAAEFIRRFLLHTLPSGLQRIRYYGLLGNRHRTENLARCRNLLNLPSAPITPAEPAPPLDYRSRYQALTGTSLPQCPACSAGRMRFIEFLPRGKTPAVIDTS